MEKIIDIVTIEDFKKQFPRFSPMYLPVFEKGKTYFDGDIVYFNDLFYKCKVENTINPPNVETDWVLTNQDVLNYTTGEDIEKAFQEANANFNESLFPDEGTKILLFLYLTAHYLTIDFNNAMGLNNVGIVTSKSVGSVSQGYTIPQWLNNSSCLSMYATTGYGIKYASLLRPYITGNVLLFRGATTP